MDPFLVVAQLKLATRQSQLAQNVDRLLPSRYAANPLEIQIHTEVQKIEGRTTQFNAGLHWQNTIIPDPFSKKRLFQEQREVGESQLKTAHVQLQIIEARRLEYLSEPDNAPVSVEIFENLRTEGNGILEEAKYLKERASGQEACSNMPPDAEQNTAFDTRWLGIGVDIPADLPPPYPTEVPSYAPPDGENTNIFTVGGSYPPGEQIPMRNMTNGPPNPYFQPTMQPQFIPQQLDPQRLLEVQRQADANLADNVRRRNVKIFIAAIIIFVIVAASFTIRFV